MQDRYVGDIGDFGKYSLLTFIQRETGFKLGVNWYLTDTNELGEENRNDGSITGYDRIKHLDADLYTKLQRLIADDERCVRKVEESCILPEATVFFSDKVEVARREEWFKRSLLKFTDCEIVFMDPDNGIGNDPCSAKHVIFSEIRSHINRGQCVIVYNHCDRSPKKNEEQKERWRNRFQPLLNMIPEISVPAIRFRRRSARDYIFVSHSNRHRQVLEAINVFLQSPWGQREKGFKTPHFDRTSGWFPW